MSPLRKPLFITNGCKIQYLRPPPKLWGQATLWGSFLNVAMATPACNPPASRFNHLNVPRTFTLPNALERDRSFIFFLDLEFFAHFHAQKGFRSGLINGILGYYRRKALRP